MEKGEGATYLDDVATDARSRMGEKEGLSREEGGATGERSGASCFRLVLFLARYWPVLT